MSKYLNHNVLQPKDLPAESGIVWLVNRYGEYVVGTATENAQKRHPDYKANRYLKLALAGDRADFRANSGSADVNIDSYLAYPECLHKCVFWPMPMAIAETLIDKFRKHELIARSQFKNKLDVA